MRMRFLAGAVAISAGLLIATGQPAAAAPPANDDFAAAVLLTSVPFEATADTTEATRAEDDPSCAGEDGHTVWYAVRLASTAELVVSTLGSDYDTTLSAWTGTRGALEQVACNDDDNGLQSRITFTAQAGETYYLMVGSFGISPGGNLVLRGGTVPPRMRLGVTVDPTGSVTAAGAAIIHGTLTCSRPGEVAVYGTLREPVGGRAVTGSFRVVVACDGTRAWRATVAGETGLFRRGSATAVAVAEFVDPLRGEVIRVRASGTVRLS